MRCIVAWSRSSEEAEPLAAAGRSATQRFFEGFVFCFDFAGLPAFLLARFTDGAAFWGAAGLLGFAAGAFGAAGGGAETGTLATRRAGIGLTGVRELVVLSGGSGCLRGRPLLRAAWPSAMSLSNAAFASARSLACCELRSDCARSFSARNTSSGLVGFIVRRC